MEPNFLKTNNILVVEDDPIMLKAISNILNKGGYRVLAAKDAKEAFELIENDVFDVAITDLMLPYANGLEVVRRIRKNDAKKNVGIIVISSMGHESMVVEAYSLGIDLYLKKPIMTTELLSHIRKLLTSKNIYRNSMSAQSSVVKTGSMDVPVFATADMCSDTIPHNSGTGLLIRKYHVAKEG